MKRTMVTFSFFLLVLVLGLVAPASGNSEWVSLCGQTSPTKPQAEVLSSSEYETIVKFTISGFRLNEVIEDNAAYRVLEFPGCASTLEPGKPQMPVISELVGIPGNTNVTIQIVDFSEEVFSGYRVYPFQTPLKEDEKREKFEIDRTQYNSDSFYPKLMAGVGEPAIWRDLRVVNLRVSPVRYNAVTGELKVCSEITVKLEYSGISNVNAKAPLKTDVAPNYDRMYRGAVLNYEELGLMARKTGGLVTESNGSYDFLIIAADDYVDNMKPFAAHKKNLGLKTRVVPVSETGARSKDIKKYIADEYSASEIKYVLLVGNETDIPGDMKVGVFSDYNYTLIDGHDDYADIALGRFCGDNDTHIDNMVNKSITFESNPPPGEWLTKSLLVAHWEDAPGKFQECKEEVRTAAQTASGYYSILEPAFTTCYGASFENGGDEASNADVIRYFNEGFRLVNYRGHGHPLAWFYWNVHYEPFLYSDVYSIDNGQMTPVIFGLACLNADLAYDSATIAETFTQGDDGAVAYLGATAPSYTDCNNIYDKQLYKYIFDDGVNAIADASNAAAVRVIELWEHWGLQNVHMYLWLGDPSLQLIYNPATSSVVEGKNTVVAADESSDKLILVPNHPNPFNPTTDISFSLPHACHVNLDIFNIVGQRITTLVNRHMEAGYHTVSFDGSKVASGVYLYRLKAGDFVKSKKMMLLK